MKPDRAAALALVSWYLIQPPWIAPSKFDVHAPLSKWIKMGKFNTVDECETVRSALVDRYTNHPEEKDASWFRRLYGASKCVPAADPDLT